MSNPLSKTLGAAVIGCTALWAPAPAQGQAEILFEDHFDGGAWAPAWVGKLCCHKVVRGRVYEQDRNGGVRDALAVVHDSDAAWTDYEVTLTAAFANQTPWEHFNVVLRSDGFERGSGGAAGTAYQLEFFGDKGWLPREKNRILLTRSNHETGVSVTLYEQPWTPPRLRADLRIALEGGRIRLWVDGEPVFDLVDPEPLPFGGVGLHTVWETRAWYDDVVVRRGVAH